MTRTTIAPLGLLLCALGAPLALAACTDAGKCARGEPGCACKTDGSCNTGATCNSEGACIARSGPPPEEDSGTPPPPPPPPDVDCVGGTFADACEAFCEAFCTMQERMCAASRCTQADCVGTICDGICADGDPACLQTRCEFVRDTTECKDFGLPHPDTNVFISLCLQQDPICIPDPEFGCSDVCGDNEFQTNGMFADNAICQDGDTGSTGTERCARGTDCTDCGARTCAGVNEPCSKNGDCCDFDSDTAFCVEGPDLCLAVCSDARPCQTGETCTRLAGSSDSVCVP